MRFYTGQHQHYCGVDLHARSMYLCILDQQGQVVLHRNLRTEADAFLQAVAPYRDDLAVAVECLFTWYWLADLCQRENLHFVLGHALYMKAIHGGKTKNDRLDAYKIAALLRGGNLPLAYAYPAEMRATRDLLRRRTHLVRQRAELLAHIQNTCSQYNLPSPGVLTYKDRRRKIPDGFPDPVARRSVELDLQLIETYDALLTPLELELVHQAQEHDPDAFHLLRSIPGIGKILALTMLYEIHDLSRFPRVQDFCSYARLIAGTHESAGKPTGTGNRKIGNVHLKWAFSEAAVLFLAKYPKARRYKDRLATHHGKAKAMAILAHKLGRIVYYILQRRRPFDPKRCFADA